MLHDVFIYPTTHFSSAGSGPGVGGWGKGGEEGEPSYLIEVDAEEVGRLLAHVRKYKLRAKVTARVLEVGELDVWSAWDEREKWTAHSSPSLSSINASANSSPNATTNDNGDNGTATAAITCPDPRAPGLGHRLLLPSSQTPLSVSTSHFPSQSQQHIPHERSHDHQIHPLKSYTLRRHLFGVPEGQSEIPYSTALPAESNIDYMSGIDFRKGCYVGQELTIRTHHIGVVRKRILPVQLYNDGGGLPREMRYGPEWEGGEGEDGGELIPYGANIERIGKKGRSAGKWVAGTGNVGLALCRLEIMTDVVLTEGGGSLTEGGGGDEFRVVWGGGEINRARDGSGEDVSGVGSKVGGGSNGGEEGRGQREVRVKAFVPDWHRNRGGVRDVQRDLKT